METELSVEPTFQWIEVTIDCVDVELVTEFWQTLLHLDRVDDPLPAGPVSHRLSQAGLCSTSNQSPIPGSVRRGCTLTCVLRLGRHHPPGLGLGGSGTGETHTSDEGTVAVMADAEGIEFCLVDPPGSVPHP